MNWEMERLQDFFGFSIGIGNWQTHCFTTFFLYSDELLRSRKYHVSFQNDFHGKYFYGQMEELDEKLECSRVQKHTHTQNFVVSFVIKQTRDVAQTEAFP